jgi:ABC-type dipeptide/oligopeptide/nickel transport system ATPase subunit
MNTPPRSQIPINTPPYPSEFQQLIREKSKNFVGREFVFTAINEFLHKYAHGYFTLIGAPGSGKSAILAKYVTSNPHVVYYNAQVEGKNRADQFLTDICTQLINQYPHVGTEYVVSLPDNATEGSWFLSLLLQEISDSLEPNQPLIIAIDALDAIAPNSQSADSNLFYLPRYLPEKVYFLLTRRPFIRERAGLLIEAPSIVLTLEDYPEQNQEDVQAYIRQSLTLPPPLNEGELEQPNVTRLAGEKLIQQLTVKSENNFMYLSQILPAIARGFYSEPFQDDRLPPGLEAYYQSHWQKMKGEELSSVELGVLRTLVTPQNSFDSPLSLLPTAGISADAVSEAIPAELIAQIIDEDEYDVEAVLFNWIEFLRRQPIDGEIYYSFYHSSFHHWLARQLNVG